MSKGSESGIAGRIQSLANVAVIVASGCVVWIALQGGRHPSQKPPSIYAVGDRVATVQGVDFQASPQTLVMALREDCRFCRDSVPFYQKLTGAVRETARGATRIVVVSTDAAASMAAYLKAHEIEVDRIAAYKPGELKIPGTPFLFVVDGTGTVTRVWRGKLPAAQEEEVFAALGLPAQH